MGTNVPASWQDELNERLELVVELVDEDSSRWVASWKHPGAAIQNRLGWLRAHLNRTGHVVSVRSVPTVDRIRGHQ